MVRLARYVFTILAFSSVSSVSLDAAWATTTDTTLTTTLKVVGNCQISKTSTIYFSQLTTAGAQHNEYATGSMTYACQGGSPRVSADDKSTGTKFVLTDAAGAKIDFSLCAVESGDTSVCTPLENGNQNQVAIAESGTQQFIGSIAQDIGQGFSAGSYSDHITISLEF